MDMLIEKLFKLMIDEMVPDFPCVAIVTPDALLIDSVKPSGFSLDDYILIRKRWEEEMPGWSCAFRLVHHRGKMHPTIQEVSVFEVITDERMQEMGMQFADALTAALSIARARA